MKINKRPIAICEEWDEWDACTYWDGTTKNRCLCKGEIEKFGIKATCKCYDKSGRCKRHKLWWNADIAFDTEENNSIFTKNKLLNIVNKASIAITTVVAISGIAINVLNIYNKRKGE